MKWRYVASRYHDERNVLMLNFLVTANETEIALGEELEEARWCTPEEAKTLIRKNSTAEYFLNCAIPELGKKR